MKVRVKSRSKKLFATKNEFKEWKQRQADPITPEQIWNYVETLTPSEALFKVPEWLCTAKKRDDGKTVFPYTVAEIKKETEKAFLIEDIEYAELMTSSTDKYSQETTPASESVWLPKSQVVCYQKM